MNLPTVRNVKRYEELGLEFSSVIVKGSDEAELLKGKEEEVQSRVMVLLMGMLLGGDG